MAFPPHIALGYLRRAHERSRMAHAYLLAGPPGSGKRHLAAEIARLVNGAALEAVFQGSAPDVYLTGPESKARRIVVTQIRELEHALQMQAGQGRRKVAIISEADRMMTPAANAFLKTLEEPPNNSLLLLLSSIPELLPDTILSRCIRIQLIAPAVTESSEQENALLDLLETVEPTAGAGVQEPYRLAHGFLRLLGQMRQRIQDENAAALKGEEARYRNTTDGAWLENREDHYKALTESLYLHERTQLVEVLFRWWSDVLRVSSGVAPRELPRLRAKIEAVAACLTTAEILRRIRRLEELRDHLGRNIQEALALEVAFLHVFRFSA